MNFLMMGMGKIGANITTRLRRGGLPVRVIGLIALASAACRALSPGAPPPTIAPTRSSPEAQTQTPGVVATPTPQCDLSRSYGDLPPAPAPEPSSLQWSQIDAGSDEVRTLDGWSSLVFSVDPSPDGSWWMVKVLLAGLLTPGPFDTALIVVNPYGSGHWLASSGGSFNSDLHQHEWRPDGDLLWIDDGRLWIGSPNGEGRREIVVPDPAREVWAGSDQIALVSGQTGLWRLHLGIGAWEEVEEVRQQDGRSPVSRGSANLGLSSDRVYALADIEGSVWRIPLAMGLPAEHLTTFEYGGRGGRKNPPQSLTGSPYWSIDDGHVIDPDAGVQGALLDETRGQMVLLSELLELPAQRFARPYVSPNGEWLAVEVRVEDSLDQDLYLAPAADIRSGFWTKGIEILAWQDEPAAVLLNDPNRVASLVRVSLPEGKLLALTSLADVNAEFVEADDGHIYVASDESIRVYSNSGDLLDELVIEGSDPQVWTDRFVSVPGGGLVFTRTDAVNDGGQTCRPEQTLHYWQPSAP